MTAKMLSLYRITSARMARIAVPHARMFSGQNLIFFSFSQNKSNLPVLFPHSTPAVTENLESLGDSITSAVLLSWNKKAGDAIAEDDVIAVVETDKVSVLFNQYLIRYA